ncbi:amidohydrolase family protein [Rubrivirga sp. IMCC45206]|uniref:amidohydrolase family protein n=1 Tax=Rubrivirga sp. IMCC45206 TaxID=3391614 RepID=UPI00399018C6
MTVRACLAAVAALALAAPALAQGISADTPLRPVTRAAAITNARVVVAPGRVLDRATVVVRDGRIVAVGRDAAVPFDAEVVEGDSLTVYAGFVDAFGYAGVPKPEDPEDYTGDRGDPPRERAGIMPDRDVRATFDATDARIKALREAGFTAAHVAPRDGLFAGQGAVVLMREAQRREPAQALVLTDAMSLVAQIDPASGVYPGTPMGVLSVMRETVENARRRRAGRTAYDQAAEGAARPRFDPVLDAVGTLLDGDRQFVFVVDGWLEGFRALRASDEMGLAPILAGLGDSAPLIERLSADDIAVFAPLALADSVKVDSTAAARELPSTTPGAVSFLSNRRIVSYQDAEAENAALSDQRRVAIARTERSPALMAQAGVPFAFGTFEVKPADVHTSLVRFVRAGLAPDDALAALTTTPAELLGLGRELGTVEVGKLANLVLTDGPLFTDSTAVRHVFVEGVGYEIEAGGPEGADPDAVVDVVGTWDFEVSTPGGTQSGTFTLTGSGDDLSGTITSDGDTDPLTSVVLEGNALTMVTSDPDIGTITISGIVTDDEFEGTAEVTGFGSLPFTATKRPGG